MTGRVVRRRRVLQQIRGRAVRPVRMGVATLMRFVPRARRFPLSVQVASAFPPLRQTRSGSLARIPNIHSVRERVLSAILDAMDSAGVGYEPLWKGPGIQAIQAPLADGRGVLLVGMHGNAGLSRLLLRSLYDARIPSTVVSLMDPHPVCGAAVAAAAIRPERNFMLAVRTKLRRGEVVCAMMDSFEPKGEGSVELRVAGGTIWIADALFHLAAACNAAVVFVGARLSHDGSLLVHLVPSSDSSDVAGTRTELLSHIRQHIREELPEPSGDSRRSA